jgi:hypothetical protein
MRATSTSHELYITARPRNEEDGASGRRGAASEARIFHPFMRGATDSGESPRGAEQSHDDARGWQDPVICAE